MTLQHRARISRFRENSFINEYVTSKLLLLLIVIFLSPLLHEIHVWALSRANFQLMRSPCWVKSSKFWEILFPKRKIYLKVVFTFDFPLSVNIGTWNTTLELFDPFLGWWCHRKESKLLNFYIVVSKTNTSPQIFLYYWLSSFFHHWCMKCKFGPFLTQFWVNDVITGVKTAIFWESDLQNKLFTLKSHQM